MTSSDTSTTKGMPEQASGPDRPRRGWPVFTVIAVAVIAFLAGGFGGSFQGKLAEVQKNDNAVVPAGVGRVDRGRRRGGEIPSPSRPSRASWSSTATPG